MNVSTGPVRKLLVSANFGTTDRLRWQDHPAINLQRPVTSLVQQLPALIGVLLGVAATYFSTSAAERARWRRAQAIRWDEKRLTAYTEYAHAVKKVIGVSVRIAAHQGMHPDIDKLPLDEGLIALASAEEERTMKWESVLMLGSEDAVDAARKWHESAFRLQLIATGRISDVPWVQAVEAASRARRGFYEVVRKDIGLAIRGSSQSYEWQLARFIQIASTSDEAERRTPEIPPPAPNR
ncbi:hypothetical protein [Nocardia lijiangensis]|uniref:hypothetical protein n=1 Tax=Nocardia lijiangensis TaxID=299618 RepID=UPI001C3FC07A|nr:hypothetical protein [Nocardia lijiangensis]